MSGEGESGPGAPAASGAAAGGADKSHLFVFSAAKAGMQGVDREHVNQVVYEMSRGSRFMANQERLDQRLQERLAGFRARMDSLQGRDLSAAARRVDAQAAEVEAAERVLDRTWAVVDMDMFFAAVELRDRPHLRGRPMAVGGTSMLSTTNYEARKYGVRSAMPGFIARRLCPDLVLVPPDGAKYKAAAAQARAVFAQYDPDLASASLDEAYLDLTGFLARRGHEARYHAACRAQPCPVSGPQAGEFNPGRAHAAGCAAVEAVVAEMRREVFARTQLTCSAGIAPNAMLAKIASDRNKPDGQFCVPPTREGVLAFARALPVRRVPGIGRVTERLLRELGVTTVQHLHDQRALLALLFSPRAAQWFVRLSLGIARAHHKPPPPGPGRKSISTERTFRAESDPGRLYTLCQGLCASLARDMAAKGLRARTLTVKLKRADFHVIQRSCTLPAHTDRAETIAKRAWGILQQHIPITLRLLGVRMHGFQNDPVAAVEGQPALTRFLAARGGAKGERSPAGEGGEVERAAYGSGPASAEPAAVAAPATTTAATAQEEEEGEEGEEVGGRLRPPDLRSVGDWLERCLSQEDKEGKEEEGEEDHEEGADRGDVSCGSAPTAPLQVPGKGDAATDTSRAPCRSEPPPTPVDAPQCPLCGRALGDISNRELNWHLDLCLNRPILRAAAAARDAGRPTGSGPPREEKRARPVANTAGGREARRKRARVPASRALDAFVVRGKARK